ncbi:uncharacterized protein LOC126410190 [Nymphaea colorata]|uniref:uncharacterized protein LOC126410190 n=1 Tax=Nymphaea colorata TaxID=210225 RepID=UPI00214F33DC|nr:uncharacterized protein LOC126410190 [Nymphaea colorata]
MAFLRSKSPSFLCFHVLRIPTSIVKIRSDQWLLPCIQNLCDRPSLAGRTVSLFSRPRLQAKRLISLSSALSSNDCPPSHQEIPQNFVQRTVGEQHKTVFLGGPSCTVWNVQLKKAGGRFSFDNGRREFVEQNSLNGNVVLVFRYDGASHFSFQNSIIMGVKDKMHSTL